MVKPVFCLAAILVRHLGSKVTFVVTERIERDFGLIGVIQRREQHGQGRFLLGGHLWQPSWVKGRILW